MEARHSTFSAHEDVLSYPQSYVAPEALDIPQGDMSGVLEVHDRACAIPLGFWLIPFALAGMAFWGLILRAIVSWLW